MSITRSMALQSLLRATSKAAVALACWQRLSGRQASRFRFHHDSTDEVVGSLGAAGKFTEATRYEPNSPWSASKAASAHLDRSFYFRQTHTIDITEKISAGRSLLLATAWSDRQRAGGRLGPGSASAWRPA